MLRIDTHHHVIPPDYRKALHKAGLVEAGGRELPEWSVETSLQAMAELNVSTAILSLSTPGTAFLPDPTDAAALARDVNDYTAELAAAQPDRFGFFATMPLPNIDAAVAETVRALDDLNADGVVLLANNAGTYLGEEGQDALFAHRTEELPRGTENNLETKRASIGLEGSFETGSRYWDWNVNYMYNRNEGERIGTGSMYQPQFDARMAISSNSTPVPTIAARPARIICRGTQSRTPCATCDTRVPW